ncbi:hypothetical protein ACHAPT_005484 [Fusarium lateritium]
MKPSLFLISLGATAVAASRSYLTWLADAFMEAGVKPTYGYQEATLYLGFERAYELSRDAKYKHWYKGQIDGHVVSAKGDIKGWNPSVYSLDDYRMGNNYLYLYEKTGEKKYRSAANVIRNHLDSHPRTPSGGFWHRKPIFANQMWLDGIFMADSFYAKWTALFDRRNNTAWNDIYNQYDLLYTHTRNKTSGLLVHGWAETDNAPWADPITGRAPHVWGRGLGWYFLSLVETLQVFPKTHPRHRNLVHMYVSLAKALKVSQDRRSGGWWQVMDEPYPHQKGNYIESSASAMFTSGLLAGVRLGYLERKEFLDTAKKGYLGLVRNFVIPQKNGTLEFTGTVAECGLVSSNVTFEVGEIQAFDGRTDSSME